MLATDFNESIMNPLATRFGVTFEGYPGLIGWQRIEEFAAHPITDGLSSVFWPYGSTLVIDDPEVEVLASFGGAPVMAARSYGAGRVFFSADNEIFARYGLEGISDPAPATPLDNEALLLNVATWLTGCGGADADGDGTNDDADNCPAIGNPDQTDTDGDGLGDACDDDDDDDGIDDALDSCPLTYDPLDTVECVASGCQLAPGARAGAAAPLVLLALLFLGWYRRRVTPSATTR